MNLDEVVNSISDKEDRESLARWVSEWKKDDTDIYILHSLVNKWHGSVWFQNENDQNVFWSNWTKFKEQAIDGIDGMTLNERMYWFGLFDEWDNADGKGRERIRGKLHAPA